MSHVPGRLDICIIVAMTPTLVIGKDGKLPWKLTSDLTRFRNRTMGHDVVMGYNTFGEIIERRGKPLEGRRNFVVTHRHADEVRRLGATPVQSALEPAPQTWAASRELFVLGGKRVFEEALPYADRMLITMVEANIDGDVYFPLYNHAQWRLESGHPVSAKHHPDDQYPSRFLEYERIQD